MAEWENVKLRKVWETFTSSMPIGHFRVPKLSLSKQAKEKTSLVKMSFICMTTAQSDDGRLDPSARPNFWREIVTATNSLQSLKQRKSFHINGFAVNQVLKLRHKATTKKDAYFK